MESTRTAKSATAFPAVPGIDLSFRPQSYFWPLSIERHLLARITIASVTQDVTCVYARRGRDRIHYRVVDEYEGETLSGKNTRTSVRPLTLGELETFLNGAWSIFDVLEMNFAEVGYDLTSLLCFVVGVESEFYPQIGTLYERRIEAWSAERRAELGLGDEEEEEEEEEEGDDGEDDADSAPHDAAAPREEPA